MTTTDSRKIKFFLFIFCICMFSFACAQKIVSLNPLFTEQDAVLIPRVEASWTIAGFDMRVSIRKAGDNFYILKYGTEKNTSVFEAAFVKINNYTILDLCAVMPDTAGDDVYRNSFVICHSFYRVQMIKDTLQLSELNYAWFNDYALKKKLPLKYEWTDNGILLTFKTGELKSFILNHIDEEKIFKKFATLTRRQTGSAGKTKKDENDFDSAFPAPVSQNCKPEFPLQNGWLGGDGDVSVPISATTTLFIFSDTYVGHKDQRIRRDSGLKMVSNSVALVSCLSNGKASVNYFWNNMYSETPQPIFKTFTSRYKFWVNDAFMIKNKLYVLLEKVGQKQGASPDDIFGFSLLGFTLAKIANPHESPDKWQIELIPLPDFVNPYMGIRSHAMKDGYVYFFVSRNDYAQLLVRKKSDFMDNPDKPFEYYALNKTWKEGIRMDDMDTLFNGFRGTTVNYHPDIKRWVMVSDIKFMDNKINIRTSPNLEGPWSDEITVYECPEVSIGMPSYKKSNFCYLPRECIQYYDAKKQEMLITYDINNSDFSEINANPEIYTPKVITVSLK